MKIIHAISRSAWHFSLLAALIVSLFVVQTGPVSAQPRLSNEPSRGQQAGDIELENVTVDIWPEYDKPSVLVIYHITLSTSASLPATVRFRIPAAAGRPNAVAWQSADNALYELNFETNPSGEWLEVQFITPAPDIQIEYYDPGIKKSGNRRDFTFRWPGDYAVQNLSLQIQKPINATNMKLVPDAGSGRAGDFGLEYYFLMVGQVNDGITFDLSVSYDKPDNSLTRPQQFQEAQPNQPLESGTTGRFALDQFLPWGVGGLGLLLIAAGSFWYWKTGRIASNRAASGRARHAGARQKRAAEPESASEATFCHQCGKKAGPGDVFCRACGTKLR